ncbi:hypothetical protein BDR22DRAFT_887638 [Usnea florida]
MSSDPPTTPLDSLPQPTPLTTNTTAPAMTTPTMAPPTATSLQPRSFGFVKSVTTTPPSLTIIPEQQQHTIIPHGLLFHLSPAQLAELLVVFSQRDVRDAAARRVSFVLEGSAGAGVWVRDVRCAVVVKEGKGIGEEKGKEREGRRRKTKWVSKGESGGLHGTFNFGYWIAELWDIVDKPRAVIEWDKNGRESIDKFEDNSTGTVGLADHICLSNGKFWQSTSPDPSMAVALSLLKLPLERLSCRQ